jgi:hypothetical protein
VNPARAPGVSRPEPSATSDAQGDGALGSAADRGSRGMRARALRSPALWLGIALVAALALPLVIALVALHAPREYPTLDMAMTEIRVRAVGTGDSPLVGLPGRIGGFGRQGSHPGPLSFWSLAPAYRLFGTSAWSLHVASVFVQTAAIGAALWIAHRRGGIRLVVGVAAVLAVLTRAYGANTLAEAWNPHLPLLMWIVLLLAVWSVLSDDLAMLPVAAFAGSFCAQTHIPYLGLGAGMVAFAFAAAFVLAYTRRTRDPDAMGRFRRWALIGAGVGALAWLLPVIDQLTASRGNFTMIWEHFGDPPEDPVGLRRGVELILIHLNPWTLVTDRVVTETPQTSTTGSWVPGLLFLGAWGATVAAAWRARLRSVVRLDVVLGVALVLAVVSAARIFGFVWYYLLLWAWGITALILLAVVWTVAVLVGRRLDDGRRERAARAGTVAVGAATLVIVALFAVDATDTDLAVPRLSETLGEISAPTADALADDGSYLVTWEDPVAIGSQGWGLLNELDRRGFDVGVPENNWPAATPDQRFTADDATAEVHLVIGPGIGAWAARPGVERVAYVEPRTPAERAEYERLRAQVIDDLEVTAPDLVENVDANLLTAAADTRISKDTQEKIVRMINIGLPTAVFVGPPSS